jgi:hypothetical protein
MQPAATRWKLAVARRPDGLGLIVATLTNLPQALFGLIALVVDVAVSGSITAALLGVGISSFAPVRWARSKSVARASAGPLSRADAVAFSEVEKVAHLDDLRLAGARSHPLGGQGCRRARGTSAAPSPRAVAISGQTSSLSPRSRPSWCCFRSP